MQLLDVIELHALGAPATKGSWRIRRKRGKVWLEPQIKRERPWAESVAWAAKERWRDRPLITEGVEVSVVFEMLRPGNPVRWFPVGDVDKLSRSVLDALTGVLLNDDVLVVKLTATKRYVTRDPGAWIRIAPMKEEG